MWKIQGHLISTALHFRQLFMKVSFSVFQNPVLEDERWHYGLDCILEIFNKEHFAAGKNEHTQQQNPYKIKKNHCFSVSYANTKIFSRRF